MKKLISILMSLLVIPLLCITPLFAQEIDLNKKGSLTISFAENYPLNGSSYALWHVAKIEATDSGYQYINTENFEDIHFTWTNEDLDYWDTEYSAPLIAFVGSYIDTHKIKPDYTGTITSDNKITFSDLDLGIYYVRQTATGPGGYIMTSYLATIPNGQEDSESDGYYNVTSNAKTDPYRPSTPDPDPDPDPDPTPTPPNRPGFNLPGTNTNQTNTTTTTNRTDTINTSTVTNDTTTSKPGGFNLPNTATETSLYLFISLAVGSILVGLWAFYKSRKGAVR